MTTEQELIAQGQDVYYGVSNYHEPEWEGQYLGVSTLVKNNATYYSRRLGARSPEDRPRKDSLWSFIGNKHADAALAPVTPYVETQGRAYIMPDSEEFGEWELVGHADGYSLPDNAIVGEEHKDYATVENNAAVSLARRQATLNLGLIRDQHRQGKRTFPLASFCDLPDAKPLVLPDEWPEEMFIRVWVCPRFGPASITHDDDPRQYSVEELAHHLRPVKVFRVTHEELDETVAFYLAKAQAVLGGLDSAAEWDHSPQGILEFEALDRVEPPNISEPHIMQAARIHHDFNQAKSDIELNKKELLAYMRTHDLTEFVTPDGMKAKLVGSWGGSRMPYVKVSAVKA